MKGMGILPGRRISYIDHIVPLCQILGFPILVTDVWIKELIELYYPPMEVIFSDPENYCFDEKSFHADIFLYVDHYRAGPHAFQFAEYRTQRKALSIYSLHGNSDKNWNTFWIERLADEDVVLLYGPQMVDFLKEKGMERRVNHLVVCGNYRLEFYRENQAFFDSKVSLPKGGKTILWAPTWSSPNLKSERRFDYSCFFQAAKWVLQSIPEDFQLIVKLHPHLVFLLPEKVEKIKEAYQDNPRIHFLDDFPLIYPLLKEVDIYLGDYSSIGYDFLYFNRPMFFLGNKKETFLQKCGVVITEKDFPMLYERIAKQENKSLNPIRHEVYSYAFGKRKCLATLKREIAVQCESIAC